MSLADDVRARRGDPDDPFDQGAAVRDYKRQARKADKAQRELVDEGVKDELDRRDAKGGRTSSATSSTPASMLPTPSLRPGDGAGFLLGLIGYALLLNVVRYGPSGITMWLRAKFLNETVSTSSTTPATPQLPTLLPAKASTPTTVTPRAATPTTPSSATVTAATPTAAPR